MADGEKSLTWIVVMLMACIALFGWGFLAGSYDGAHSPNMSEMDPKDHKDVDVRMMRRPDRVGIAKFIGNAIAQLPNMPTVISWHMSNRIWLPITIIALEVGALLGAILLKRVEKALEAPRRRR